MPETESSSGPQQRAADDTTYRCLMIEIKAGRTEEVENLLTQHWMLTDRQLLALFKAAVKGGQPQIIRCLLRRGVVPLRESPIFLAIENLTSLQVVLAEGYSVHVTSCRKKRPLQVAITLNPAALPVLLRTGCDVTARDGTHGNTALHTACTQHEAGAVLALVRAGAWLNAPNWRGETPLYCVLVHACSWRDFHAKSRQSLARSLIYMGFRIATLPRDGKHHHHQHNDHQQQHRHHQRQHHQHHLRDRGTPDYKVILLYRSLVKETRSAPAWSLQHLCRLRIRQLFEEGEGAARVDRGEPEGDERGGGGEETGGGGGDGGRERSVTELVETFEVSQFLKDYLMYHCHTFDKTAETPGSALRLGNSVTV